MNNGAERNGKHGTLYQSVADRISDLIACGTLAPGARIPSVRRLSEQFEVSITTVTEAYRVLEDQGLIEARPQSGYYVCERIPKRLPEPDISQPPAGPAPVSVSDLLRRLLRDVVSPGLLQLGTAIANPALLPIERLHQIGRASC